MLVSNDDDSRQSLHSHGSGSHRLRRGGSGTEMPIVKRSSFTSSIHLAKSIGKHGTGRMEGWCCMRLRSTKASGTDRWKCRS